MESNISKLAIAIAAAASLTACGGSSSSDPAPTNNDGGTSLQKQFSGTGDYGVIESPAGFSIDSSTLAVNTTETTTAQYDSVSGNAGSASPNNYFGAVDPGVSAGNQFWANWTIRDSAIEGNLPGSSSYHPLEDNITGGSPTITPNGSPNCSNVAGGLTDGGAVSVFGTSFPVCVIRQGDLDGNYTLSNGYVYVLDGTVQVGNGDQEGAHAGGSVTVSNYTLTIEQGTQIFGASNTKPSLVITRGSQIDATGTSGQPIIFGAVAYNSSATNVITDDPANLGGRGEWGSLVLSGYGEINSGDSNNQATTEAVPDGTTRWFGGTDNADNSGTVSYVVLAETGEAFRPDEEVQGLTLEGVGSGTSIDHVQITNSNDDGIEFFGGAADVSNAVIQGVADDSLDIDLGYQGVIQKALVLQGSQHGDRGIESDNNGSNFGATPKTSPILANVTVLGNAGDGGSSDLNTVGALHREGFGGQVYRSVYADNSVAGTQFDSGCLDLDDEVDEDLAYGDVLFHCAAGPLANDSD